VSILTNVIHFRGETVTLYATFKQATSVPESTGILTIQPTVRIEYVNSLGNVITTLPDTQMSLISKERFFYNWLIPDSAPITAYIVTYTGIIDEIEASRTEELVVGNPNITTKNRCMLRYGPGSVLLRPRDFSVRPHPAQPRIVPIPARTNKKFCGTCPPQQTIVPPPPGS